MAGHTSRAGLIKKGSIVSTCSFRKTANKIIVEEEEIVRPFQKTNDNKHSEYQSQ